jgi:DNA-binding NtrC family response regulator
MSPERAAGSAMSVLVADDDEDMRALVVDALRRDGHDVVEASNGEELLFALEAGIEDPSLRPDVVVCDVKMPKLSGLGVLAAIHRAHLRYPVLLMTVLTDETIDSVAKSLGAVGVLRKPFDVDDLRTAVLNAMLSHVKSKAREHFRR